MAEDDLNAWTNLEHYEAYVALLGLGESLKRQGEPQGAHKCLLAILNLQVPYAVSARVYCEIGKLLLEQSTSYDVAKQYLEQALQMGQNATAASVLEDVKLDACSALAQLHVAQDSIGQARDILHNAIEQSQHSPYWQCHFIFQLAHAFMLLQDHTVAGQILTLGESFSARYQAHSLTLLFQLTRSSVQLRAKQPALVLAGLSDLQTALQSTWNSMTPLVREELRFYLICLEAMARLNVGQAKRVRGVIQNLQGSLDLLSQLRSQAQPAKGVLDMFALAPASAFPLLTYAVSAQFFGLIGYHDKLERVMGRCGAFLHSIDGMDDRWLQDEVRCSMLETIIPASLTTGRYNQALNHVAHLINLCGTNKRVMRGRRGQLHLLLGLCAFQFGYNEVAESQLNFACRHCTSPEMLLFIQLNQAMLFLRQQRWTELTGLVQRVRAVTGVEHVALHCCSLLLQAIQALLEYRGTEAKMVLRTALQMSNDEDVNQLMAVALTVMARNCMLLGEWPDVIKVARTACDLAEKIPDHPIQMAALTTLSEVYALVGDHANQTGCANSLATFTHRETLETQNLQQNPQLSILQWTG